MRRISTAAGLLFLVSVLQITPASAATGVTIVSASQSGTAVLVSGAATFDDQPFVQLGTDAAGDAPNAAQAAIGGDLVAASARTTVGSIQLRWTVVQLPPEIGPPWGAGGYGWNFCTGEEVCFELDVFRNHLLETSVTPVGELWSCADSTCDPGDQSLAGSVNVAFNETAKTVTASLTAGQISAGAGTTITSVQGPDDKGPVFSFGPAGPYDYDAGDGIATVADYTVAKKDVSLAVAAPGQDPATVTYSTTVTPAANGSYAGSVDVSGLPPGDYTVYARGCFGSNNCALATAPVTLA